MSGFRFAMAVVIGSAMLGAPARAAVLCQKKSGAAFIRDACKKKETAVDAAGLGLQGPPGDKGDKGDKGDQGDAGTPGAPGSSRAYALVSHTAAFKNGIVKNFTAVNRPGTGVYCLTVDPAAGITIADIEPLVTVDWDASSGNNLMVMVDSTNNDCVAGQFEINTFIFPAGGSAAFSDGVDFFVTVP